MSETELLYTQVLLNSQKSLAWQYVAPRHFFEIYLDKNTFYQRDDWKPYINTFSSKIDQTCGHLLFTMIRTTTNFQCKVMIFFIIHIKACINIDLKIN